MKKKWKYGAVIIAAVGVLLGFLLALPRPPRPLPPVPNGYDTLIQAAGQARTFEPLSYGEANEAELRRMVDANKSALALARSGLTQECQVTFDYRLSLAVSADRFLPTLGQVKKLALAFRAQGELAERESKANEAARNYVDGIQFAQQFCRGGLLIHRLVGVACEGMQLDALQSLGSSLDAQACKDLARRLEQLDKHREPLTSTWEAESSWALRSGNTIERIKNRIGWLVSSKSRQSMQEKTTPKLEQIVLRERDLMLRLAARAYELDHGTPPKEPRDLVPEYLSAAPKHALTNEELRL